MVKQGDIVAFSYKDLRSVEHTGTFYVIKVLGNDDIKVRTLDGKKQVFSPDVLGNKIVGFADSYRDFQKNAKTASGIQRLNEQNVGNFCGDALDKTILNAKPSALFKMAQQLQIADDRILHAMPDDELRRRIRESAQRNYKYNLSQGDYGRSYGESCSVGRF